MVLRDAGSIPPGLPGVFVVTGSPAGCATGTGGAAQAIPCGPPVLLALVGQSGISSRTGRSLLIRRVLKPSSGQSEASASAVGQTRLVLFRFA